MREPDFADFELRELVRNSKLDVEFCDLLKKFEIFEVFELQLRINSKSSNFSNLTFNQIRYLRIFRIYSRIIFDLSNFSNFTSHEIQNLRIFRTLRPKKFETELLETLKASNFSNSNLGRVRKLQTFRIRTSVQFENFETLRTRTSGGLRHP